MRCRMPGILNSFTFAKNFMPVSVHDGSVTAFFFNITQQKLNIKLRTAHNKIEEMR